MKKQTITEIDKVVIRFSGDSGDGMQLTGTQFAETSAVFGNDVVSYPDYPAEIRAPQGSVAGVSSFQIQIGKTHVYTPGDLSDVLVAMNAAALKANIHLVKPGSMIIVDTDSFDSNNLRKAGYEKNPLDEPELNEKFRLLKIPVTSLTRDSVSKFGLDNKSVVRCKNMFTLGLVFWLYSRPLEPTVKSLRQKFSEKPELFEANRAALEGGFNYAETMELVSTHYVISPAQISKGKYRFISGNRALAWGFLAAAEKTGKHLFLGSYPITPASEILHELSALRGLGAIVFQAEDEICGVASAIGASFAGHIALTTTSGPGLSLKTEAIGLAVIAELPLVIVNVQRGGPSTGLPTKTEQSDLLQAVYGRHGECPVVVLAARSPDDCFYMAYEAVKISIEHMTPVLLLSDGFIAQGSQLWKIPDLTKLPEIKIHTSKENGTLHSSYDRDEKTLARYWAPAGIPGGEHRLGGLEKDFLKGTVSYDPDNHEKMVRTRAEKVNRVVNFIPEQDISGDPEGDLLLVGWGGTYGAMMTATEQLRSLGRKVGLCHFRYINPMPGNCEEIFSKYKKIAVCELNMGQMAILLRSRFQKYRFEQINKIKGMPFMVQDIINGANKILG
ncbi:MAG: 2-oxoacid:acceptor oxidoreductase subunit alpha [Bacteroidetes bacterium]|nr:2-oxoacid:acceptor oxidoreductase subunit alpha [Bacteroidota bacterium]